MKPRCSDFFRSWLRLNVGGIKLQMTVYRSEDKAGAGIKKCITEVTSKLSQESLLVALITGGLDSFLGYSIRASIHLHEIKKTSKIFCTSLFIFRVGSESPILNTASLKHV